LLTATGIGANTGSIIATAPRVVKKVKLAIKQAFTALPLHLLICFLMAVDKV
jgi:hypothetical protein